MTSDEPALIARLRRGDTAAFDVLYERYRARIFNFLARMTGRRELAEDLVQETFLRLVRFAPRLADDTRLEFWLLTVARNLCRSQYRWAFVDRASMAVLALEPAAPERDPSPFAVASARELEREVERALARLGYEQREILILTAIERLATPDIAQLLGLTPEAVRQRLARARKQLAALLENGASEAAAARQTRWVSDEA